MTRREV